MNAQPRQNERKSRPRFAAGIGFAIAALAVLALLALAMVGGPSGLMKLYRLGGDVRQIEFDLQRTTATVDSLKREIERLKTDTAYIEKIARERLGMARKNEKVFRFADQK
jgi:cell division protein FtsB